jgi:hypothetical protein
MNYQLFQGIILAHKRQAETEENLYQLAVAERDSCERDLRHMNKTFHELGERRLALQVCQKGVTGFFSNCYRI